MSRKNWLIAAAILVASGLLIGVVAMSLLGWDFKMLSNSKTVHNEHEIKDDFTSIFIDTNTANLKISPTDGEARVVCDEWDNMYHEVFVENGVLKIEFRDERRLGEKIGIGFGSGKVSVYLPKHEYDKLFIDHSTGDIEIVSGVSFRRIDAKLSTGDLYCASSASEHANFEASTGKITIENATYGSLNIKTTTGDVSLKSVEALGDLRLYCSTGDAELENVKCKSFISEAGTGGLTMKNLVAENKMDIERSTGDIKLDSCDAAEIEIETDTGSVSGTLKTGKIFITESDTGKIKVPASSDGGRCVIETDTGDIKIEIAKD